MFGKDTTYKLLSELVDDMEENNSDVDLILINGDYIVHGLSADEG